MDRKIALLILVIFSLSISVSVFSQIPLTKKWDTEKIRGERNLPHPSFEGFPYLNRTWVIGKIEFNDGEVSDSLDFRYSSFKDELVYFNREISAQIVVDKASLKGFSYVDSIGISHIFRRQYFDGFAKGNRYFEVLSDADIDLLVYRKVKLSAVSPYKSVAGILRDQAYTTEYQYYFYSPTNGYTLVRPTLSGLLSKFDHTSQRPIKKLLRKNRIRISDEDSFVLAWKCVDKVGFQLIF